MADDNTCACDETTDCLTEIPAGNILPPSTPSTPLTPDQPRLGIIGTLVSQTVTERSHTNLDTKELASSKSKDVNCDYQVELPVETTQITSGGGSTQFSKVKQSISFQITIPVVHIT